MLSRQREELDPLSGNKLWHGHHRLTAFSCTLAITLELLVLAPLATLLCKRGRAHQTKTQTRTVSKEQTKGALSKALSVAGLMDPPCLIFIQAKIRPGFKVLVAEAATSICRSIASCHLLRPDHVAVRLASQHHCQANWHNARTHVPKRTK